MNLAYNADCMEVMRQTPDKYFDLAVVDPPYFSGPDLRRFYGKEISSTGIRRREYPICSVWEVPDIDYFAELTRVAKKYIVWGCNYYPVVFPHGRIIWDKCNGDSSFSDCEIAATNCHDSVRLFRYMWNGMMQGKSIAEGHIMQGNKALNERRIHVTQKPVALYEWIFLHYAHPGDKVLDTHLGSGSSRIAAYNAGLDFVGREIDKTIFTAQEKRFEEHTMQTSLFHTGEVSL